MVASVLRLGLTATLTATCMMIAAANPPAVTAFGYARELLPGIPASPGSSARTPALPTEYYLFIEVPAGSHVSANWTSVRGQYYAASLEKVATPVLLEADAAVPTGQKETLVPKTGNDVYRVVLGGQLTKAPDDERGRALTTRNEAVTSMTIGQSVTYALTRSLKGLRPKAGM